MSAENGVFSSDYKLKSYDLDFRGASSIQSICRYIQDAADQHSFSLGVSVEKMLKKGITWVLSRLHLTIHQYPIGRDTINIETWPSECLSRFALREFLLSNSENIIIGKGTSSWMIIDIRERRSIEIPDFIRKKTISNRGRAIADSFEKISEIHSPDLEKSFDVRIADLDVNQHANNIQYIDWIIEPLPFAMHQSHQLVEIEIGYKAETKYPDRIISQVQTVNLETEKNSPAYYYHHRLIRESDGKEVAAAVTRWQPFNKLHNPDV